MIGYKIGCPLCIFFGGAGITGSLLSIPAKVETIFSIITLIGITLIIGNACYDIIK